MHRSCCDVKQCYSFTIGDGRCLNIGRVMATQPSDDTGFPLEIILKPLALIGLSGLDTINNAVHKTIWDAFCNNRRPDRASVRFKLLNNTFEFPVVKPKRNSYEWYIPKGILKKNWIHKRVNLIPAVVVIFYDMEWNDPQWNEKIIECASRVQSIRAAVEGHATRVAVVVVQSGLSPPPSEYMLGAERAQALCSACEIQSKSLFVLPHSDHLMGYIIRLENAFYDIAQNYYHHETKNIKQHRDHLNKTTHQYLYVRHQFKLGYLNELKQDLSTSHKHYMHSYINLLETRTVDTNIHEIRTVSGYINYKLCKLLFALNLPRDAIAQLKSHIERFKSRVGPTELLFEHYAWIARQYSSFGELFDEAIRAGLPAIQSQHPGFYFQQAAQFTVMRRQAMRSVCCEAQKYPPPPDPLEGLVEFYGQRPWRPGRLCADPHDPLKEQAATLALQYNERTFNHSGMIISFLGSAISQFKTFHSPRMRKQLVVEMANEYYVCADYGKALTLLTHMLWDYRRERWWFLASHVLNRALQCAYLSAKIQDYVQLSVEALSKHVQVPNMDKDRIFRNIMSILDLNLPSPEPDLPAASQSKALELWHMAIEKEPFVITIDMANISSFLEVKTKFTKQHYRTDEVIEVELFVRLTHVASLEVKKLSLTISSSTETIEIPVTDNGYSEISLFGGKVRKFLCQFKSNPRDRGTDMQIKNVSFVLDSGRKRKIIMNFKIDVNEVLEPAVHPELLHFILSPKADYEFDCIVALNVASVSPRECRLSLEISNECPALQGEWFPTLFTITNNEHTVVDDLIITLSLLSTPDNPNPDSVTELSWKQEQCQVLPLTLSVGVVNRDCSYSNTFYLKSNRTTSSTVQIKVTYIINLPETPKFECVKEFVTKITVTKPFEVTTHFTAMNFKPVTKCFVNDPFIVMPLIKILSPWDLLIVDTELEVASCFKYSNGSKPSSCINNLEVAEKNTACDAISVQAKYKPKDLPTRVGLYNITWRRSNVEGHCVRSTTALSGIPVDDCPIAVEVNYPEVVELQTSVLLKCILYCNSDTPVRLCISVEGTDAYMFSGYKKLTVTVPPHDRVELHYKIQPLVTGNTMPPQIKATLLDDSSKQEVVKEMLEKTIPQNIFVMPKYNK